MMGPWSRSQKDSCVVPLLVPARWLGPPNVSRPPSSCNGYSHRPLLSRLGVLRLCRDAVYNGGHAAARVLARGRYRPAHDAPPASPTRLSRLEPRRGPRGSLFAHGGGWLQRADIVY